MTFQILGAVFCLFGLIGVTCAPLSRLGKREGCFTSSASSLLLIIGLAMLFGAK